VLFLVTAAGAFRLRAFRHEPWAGDVFLLSAQEAHKMLDSKLGTLETAIRKNLYREFGQPENV